MLRDGVTMVGPIRRIKALIRTIGGFDQQLRAIQETLGRIEARQNSKVEGRGIHDQEFKVYSQWGEDGIIQFLLRHVEIKNSVFVEFGVGNYLESNTRFLLVNNNWSGLALDSSDKNISFIKNDPLYWKYNLKAACEYIDKNNINPILENNNVTGDIGILSIDIDGNDYWVWKEISSISPRIVICEYNSLFGSKNKVTVPYRADFDRRKAHFSNLYFGASLACLTDLAISKGYSLVGSNSNGVNAFFVRNDVIGDLHPCSVEEAYVKSKCRESRDINGNLSYLSFEEAKNIIADMELVDVSN